MKTTHEIANAVAFFLSECSSHTTGQLVHVDGGYVRLDRALGMIEVIEMRFYSFTGIKRKFKRLIK